jgi:mannose-6-phosphate isomerase-like protein (cupin superfamily)
VLVEVSRVEKPWGYELIWAHTDRYVGKILHIRAGEALSLQYHERKDETIHVLRGSLSFQVGGGGGGGALREVRLEEGQSFRIEPGTRHRVTALSDCDLLEASTPELDDVVRLDDRYGRI